MLQAFLIGNLGANAELVNADGGKFVKFRVAHTDSWTDATGTKQSRTTWVDCTMNCSDGREPAVFPYLIQGTLVFVQGTISLRVYSSQRDRCMKAGMTLHVSKLDLLGGARDLVPRQLFTADGQTMLDVQKYFNVPGKWPKEGDTLVDRHGALYAVDKNGWVVPAQPQATEANADKVQESVQ